VRAFLEWKREYSELKRKRFSEVIGNIAECEPQSDPLGSQDSDQQGHSGTRRDKPRKINTKKSSQTNSREFTSDIDKDIDIDKEIKPLCPAAAGPRRGGALSIEPWVEEQHERWYLHAYWRRVKKDKSLPAYARRIAKLMARGMDRDAAAEFLFRMAVEDRKRSENTADWDWRKNLLPATWLNGERWNDESGPAKVTQIPTASDRRRAETLAGIGLINKIEGRA
jgi:hypothetical protein